MTRFNQTTVRPDDYVKDLERGFVQGEAEVFDPNVPDRNVYYPAVAVQLSFRFDEKLTRIAIPKPTPQDATLIGPPQEARAHHPLVETSSEDQLTFTRTFVPRSARIELPSHRKAETFTCTFDFKHVPIDPRALRSASVALLIGTIPADTYADAMLDSKVNGVNLYQEVGAFARAQFELAATVAMIGNVDNWSIDDGPDGAIITLEGRGNAGMLLASPFLAANIDLLDLEKPIDEVVRDILGYHPILEKWRKFVVAAPPSAWPEGRVPIVAWEGSDPPHRQSPKRKKAKGKPGKHRKSPNAASDLSFWDLITQFAFLVGAIPRWRGQWLEIIPARSLYDQALLSGTTPDHPTPFAGGRARRFSSGEPLYIRRLVVGQDTDTLSIKREFGGPSAQVVKVVSYNPSAGTGRARVLEAQYPEDADLPSFKGELADVVTQVASDGKKTSQDFFLVTVKGIGDLKRLKEIAKAIFDERRRGEFKGTVTMRKLHSQGGSSADPDMLRLKPGDAVEIVSDMNGARGLPPAQSELAREAALDYDALVDDYTARFGNDDTGRRLAQVLAAVQRDQIAELQRIFYTENVSVNFDTDSGIDISFDFTTFVEVAKEEEPEPAKRLGRRRGPNQCNETFMDGDYGVYGMSGAPSPLPDLATRRLQGTLPSDIDAVPWSKDGRR